MSKKNLTSRERKLFKCLTKGMSIADAAIAAGYSAKNPSQSGHQALERIRRNAPQLLAKHGLDDDSLIEKYLAPALEANETKFFQKDGIVTDSRDVIAWGPRLSALDMAMKIRGMYSDGEEVDPSRARMTVILDIPRPVKNINANGNSCGNS